MVSDPMSTRLAHPTPGQGTSSHPARTAQNEPEIGLLIGFAKGLCNVG